LKQGSLKLPAMSQAPEAPNRGGGVREHLANERTYLAYMRTAIALVSFGITINRFSLFLLEKQLLTKAQSVLLDNAEDLGIIMVILGMACMLWAGFAYADVSRQIETGVFRPRKRAIWIITFLVFGFSALSLYWLFQR
jgi:putative membrane protein